MYTVTKYNGVHFFLTNSNTKMGCPNDAAMCKSVEKSNPGSNEEIFPRSTEKLKGPPSFTDFVDDESEYLT